MKGTHSLKACVEIIPQSEEATYTQVWVMDYGRDRHVQDAGRLVLNKQFEVSWQHWDGGLKPQRNCMCRYSGLLISGHPEIFFLHHLSVVGWRGSCFLPVSYPGTTTTLWFKLAPRVRAAEDVELGPVAALEKRVHDEEKDQVAGKVEKCLE